MTTLDDTTRYETSRYVRTLRTHQDRDFTRPGGLLDAGDVPSTVAFHSLFGNARLIEGDVPAVLREARRAALSLEDLRQRLDDDSLTDLFDASYLVPEGFDEEQQIDELLRDRASNLSSGAYVSMLQLVLTNACDFSCEGCFAYNFDSAVTNRRSAGEPVKPGPTLLQLRPRSEVAATLGHGDWNDGSALSARNPRMHMTPAVAEKTVAEAVALRKARGADDLSIAFFGGEPTLNKKTILHVLRTFGNEYDGVRLAYRMTTNGATVDDEVIEEFARCGVGVSISVDYVDHSSGEFRAGGPQRVVWSDIRANIARYVAGGVHLKLGSVLSSQTWSKWGTTLIDEAAALGIDEIDVIVAFQAREFFAQHAPSDVVAKLMEAYDYGQRVGVQLTGYWYHTFLMLIDAERWAAQADYKTCPAVGRKLSIEPNGSVFACKATARQLGTIDSWQDIFSSSAYQHYGMRAYKNGPACSGCELQGTCSGGSSGALENETGSIREMSPGYCAYMREVVHELLQRHALAAAATA